MLSCLAEYAFQAKVRMFYAVTKIRGCNVEGVIEEAVHLKKPCTISNDRFQAHCVNKMISLVME